MLQRRSLIRLFAAAPVVIAADRLMPVRSPRLIIVPKAAELQLTADVWDRVFFAQYVRQNRFAQYMGSYKI